MKFRSIVDVKIAPDGQHVAYVVSTPSLTKGEHEGALYIVSAAGGAPSRLGESIRIFNPTAPAPRLRWSPDGSMLSLLAFAGERPQVFAIPLSGAAPHARTDAPEGVSGFEWSPDGKGIGYLTRDPMSAEETQQRKDKSFVIHADAPDRPTRVVWKQLDGATRVLTPPSHYVDSFSWSPDGREIAYSAASKSGFTAQYLTRIYAISLDGETPRAIVDRPGMNTRPQYSPDGRWIAFVSTNGKSDIMSTRGLAIVPARGGESRMLLNDDAWIYEFAWARDSRSIYFEPNDGAFASHEHMFEQPIVRAWLESGRSERVIPGETVDYSLSLSG